MSTTMEELGRRAVACRAWRWMCGLRIGGRDGGRYVLPDFSDPATLGCLLSLVREAYGDPGLHLVCYHTTDGPIFSSRRVTWWALARSPDAVAEWEPRDYPASRLVLCAESVDSTYFAAATEAEALVFALENAP